MSFASSFAQQGFLLIPRLFDPAFIGELHREYERQGAEIVAANNGAHYEVGDKRTQLAIAFKGAFLDPQLWANPLLLQILRTLIAPDILLDSVAVVVARPGAAEQHRHRDHPRLFPDLPPETSLPTHAVTVMVPLIAIDTEVGSTMLSPGTHRGEASGAPVPALVPEGGCYLMHYDLEHWGSANVSQRDRPLLTMTYARPWFTDAMNFRHNPRLNIRDEDARSLPQEHWLLFRRLHPAPFPQVRSHKLSKEGEA
jgi:ectoine hydroxylase-related dioxygenase (phytanoyl-CoA dioxygenase family)